MHPGFGFRFQPRLEHVAKYADGHVTGLHAYGGGCAGSVGCATQNGAYALQLDKVGCIEPGWQADLLLLDCPDYREMAYFYGENHVYGVIKKGVLV